MKGTARVGLAPCVHASKSQSEVPVIEIVQGRTPRGTTSCNRKYDIKRNTKHNTCKLNQDPGNFGLRVHITKFGFRICWSKLLFIKELSKLWLSNYQSAISIPVYSSFPTGVDLSWPRIAGAQDSESV